MSARPSPLKSPVRSDAPDVDEKGTKNPPGPPELHVLVESVIPLLVMTTIEPSVALRLMISMSPSPSTSAISGPMTFRGSVVACFPDAVKALIAFPSNEKTGPWDHTGAADGEGRTPTSTRNKPGTRLPFIRWE